MFVSYMVNGQGVTTASMTGTITDNTGESLIGANVVAIHTPSGTSYGTITNLDGQYSIPGMRVGGPYRVVISYVGYSDMTFSGIMLRLGENYRGDYMLAESSELIDVVEVVAVSGVTGQNVGTSTQITGKEIDAMPTLDRDINDFLRLTPQASLRGEGSISFAGMNNRFNAIYVDGAVNNDVFGLAGSGTNGGQTGISPFSIDIIDQLQVVLSPYDVTLGGFAGGGINAVTKSGTNQLKGTAYYFVQNENLVGRTNQKYLEQINGTEREKAADFTQATYGASLGGPIVKDKVFFFANAEIQRDETPSLFDFENYAREGRYTQTQINGLISTLKERYGYDAGTYGNIKDQLDGVKFFGKLDFNLNDSHKLTVRHNYTRGEQLDRNVSNNNTINLSNNGLFFPTTTNSSAIELNSRFGNNASNNLIIGYTNVNDDRDAIGQDFPFVIINDAESGSIRFGTEAFSSANALTQSIFTLTDNFKLYKGSHTLTFGTHNEFYDIYNLFIPFNFGQYRFNSLDDFLSGAPAAEYDRNYSLVDNITGDGSAAAAEFNALQLGFYAQDEWRVNRKFNLTYGLRLDVPIITSDPVEDTNFNTVALPKMQAQYDIAKDIRAGSAPDGQLMWSPRVGFEFLPDATRGTVLRGGVGIFTSRIPFVWPGAMFNNNGLTQGNVDERSITNPVFVADVDQQYTNPNFSIPSGDINIFTNDFKYPQILRGNLAIDKQLPFGINASLEGIFSKTLNNVVYTNVNSSTEGAKSWTGGPDNRDLYARKNIDSTYSAVYVGHNTNEGYTYNVTASLMKEFDSGLFASLAYTYGDAYSVNDGTSSQNSSQWRGQVSIDGRNNPVFGRADYAVKHRFVGNLGYTQDWGKKGFGTSVSLFYNGQSGDAFSYVIGGNSARNLNNESGSTSRNRSLVYIPASRADINLVNYTSGGTTVTADEQWNRLNAFIESDPYLSKNRGGYSDKNGGTAPFNHRFDLGIRQDLGADLGGDLHRLQISFDVFNVANLLNKSWGINQFLPGDFNNYFLYEFTGYEADGTTPKFNYRGGDSYDNASQIGNFSSRWQGRLGISYIFN